MTGLAVRLPEWDSEKPIEDSPLVGMILSPEAREIAHDLRASDRLEILELPEGLEINSYSWVGRVVLDELTITILPKIDGLPLLNLLRYAYKLRDLRIIGLTRFKDAPNSFQDVILKQLALEAEELIYRGLHQEYERTLDDLAIPRGRIDFQKYVNHTGATSATLPCIYHPRTHATLLNEILMAGLTLGAQIADDSDLKVHLRDLAKKFDQYVMVIELDQEKISRGVARIDRRTEVYRSALKIVEMLVRSLGISFDDPDKRAIKSPGFLFDMNLFFQALIERFLGENIIGYTVENQFGLKGFLSYPPAHNSRHRSAPKLRPDFVVTQSGAIKAVLDAKYRDLWTTPLPASMLYQLTIYALTQPAPRRRSTILYPSLCPDATDQIVEFRGPLEDNDVAQVLLRPVNLLELEKLLVGRDDHVAQQAKFELADKLVWGAGVES